MGFLDSISELCESCHIHHGSNLKKRKQLQTVEIKVKMDCEGCERRVKKSVEGMKGVTNVEVEPKQSKLTVTGYVDAQKVLERMRHRTGKKAEIWPYVPYDVVPHPYAHLKHTTKRHHPGTCETCYRIHKLPSLHVPVPSRSNTPRHSVMTTPTLAPSCKSKSKSFYNCVALSVYLQ